MRWIEDGYDISGGIHTCISHSVHVCSRKRELCEWTLHLAESVAEERVRGVDMPLSMRIRVDGCGEGGSWHFFHPDSKKDHIDNALMATDGCVFRMTSRVRV